MNWPLDTNILTDRLQKINTLLFAQPIAIVLREDKIIQYQLRVIVLLIVNTIITITLIVITITNIFIILLISIIS